MLACLLVTHSPTAGVSYSVCRMLSRSFDDAIVMQIVTCHSRIGQKSVLLVTDQSRSRHQRMSSSPPAQGRSPRSFSSQISPGQPRSRHTAHVVFSAAQPGRNWLCLREALLPLARSYRMKGMPRAGRHCCIHRGSIAVRIVMVRRREEGGELSSCSSLSQCDALQRNDRRRDNQEDRIQGGRSRVLASNWPCRQGFLAAAGPAN